MGLTIAIDGPASSGKGTAARALARALGYAYIDTGAMYRSLALVASERGVGWSDADALGVLAASLAFDFAWDGASLRVSVDGRDVTEGIRTQAVGEGASAVSQHSAVRAALLGVQRALGAEGRVVMDGRDIGTVVLPDADLKIYLDADLDERARRRCAELRAKGDPVDELSVRARIAARDDADRGREAAPLRPAHDAVHLDSTAMAPAEVVAALIALARARGA